MKLVSISALALFLLVGCGDKEPNPSVIPPSKDAAIDKVQSSLPVHNYVMQDGAYYGYEPEMTDKDKKEGKLVKDLVMLVFLGEKDGKYQVATGDGQDAIVVECDRACDFVKLRVFSSYGEPEITYMRALSSMLGVAALQDGINGHLKVAHTTVKGKKYSVWYTDKGMEKTLMPETR